MSGRAGGRADVSKILCVARKLRRDHAKEMGDARPKGTIFFLKPTTALFRTGGHFGFLADRARFDVGKHDWRSALPSAGGNASAPQKSQVRLTSYSVFD